MFVGIDFGTSKSVVGFWDHGKPTIIPDRHGRRTTPSVVMVAPDEGVHIGWGALNRPCRYHSETVTIGSIKRTMEWAGESGRARSQTYHQEVSALILGRLKIRAELYCDEEVTGAVIAVPANYDINQRWAIMRAARICGIKVCRLLNGATAAALTYSLHARGEHGVALVFDFGAGALDVSIVEYGCGIYEVIATAGDDRLGGDDFDQAIFGYLLERIEQELGSSVELSPMQQIVLKESATRAKLELSEASTSRIYLPGFVNIRNRLLDLDVTIDRNTAESLWGALFDRMENVLGQAIQDWEDWNRRSVLTDLLLIGGTSLIPRVRERVEAMTGLDPFMGADLEMLVAQGASMWAGVLDGKVRDILLLDAVSRSYSVEKMGGVCEKVIPRNTTIPTRKEYHATTTNENQTEVAIRVFEGEGELSKENRFVGELRLSGLQGARKGSPEIEMVFEIDANNTLFVSAEDKASGNKVETAMKSPRRMNPAQMKASQRKVECELLNLKQRDAEAMRIFHEDILLKILAKKYKEFKEIISKLWRIAVPHRS